MKNYILIIALLISTLSFAQKSSINQFFNQYQNKNGVTVLTLNKGMFNMMNDVKFDKEFKDWNNVIKNINSIKMLVVENSKNSTIKNDLRKSFQTLKLEELMTINKDGNKVKFYTENSAAKTYKNILLDISTSTETVYFMLDGNIKAEDLKKGINNVSIK